MNTSPSTSPPRRFTLSARLIALLVLLALAAGLVFGLVHLSRQNARLKDTIVTLTILLENHNKTEVETVREELKQISQYSVYEFNYTSVMTFSDVNKLWKIKIPFTSNNFIAAIDGNMNIGIDADKLALEEKHGLDGIVDRIVVTLPHADILDSYTIPESLIIYDQKSNPFNPVNIEDYNDLLVQVQTQEETNLRSGDILSRADDTVQGLLSSHLKAVYGENVEIEFKYLENAG